MSLPKIETRSLLTDQVFEAIRGSIMNGEMPAGYRLRIRDLAEQVGTSVMPVREAIRRLEEAGLAERVPHKGAVVRGLTLDELLHVYEVRRLLEVEAARLGAEKIKPAEVDAMRAELEVLRRAITENRVIECLDSDEALLTILYRASGNPVMVSAIRALWEQCRSYKILGAHAALESPDQSPLWSYPEELVRAAQISSPDLAARASNESLLTATERIRNQLAAQAKAAEEVAG